MNNGTCGSGCGDLALDIPLDLISGGLARTGRTGYSLLASAFQFTSHQTPGGFGEPYAWNVNVPAIVASYSNWIA